MVLYIVSVSKDQASAKNSHIITYLNIFFFVALAAGAVALFKPVEARLHTMLAGFRNDAIGMAEQALNRKISYGSMKTTLFNVLDIRNVTIDTPEGASLPLLSISRIRVSWSLMDILTLLMQNKVDSIGKSVHVVRIDKPLINIDLEKDADILKLLAGQEGDPLASDSLANESLALKDMLNENAALLINNGTVHAALNARSPRDGEASGSELGAFTLDASGLRIDARIKNNRLFFDGSCKAAATSSKLDKALSRPVPVSLGLDIKGSSNLDFTDIDAGFTLASFSSPLFDVAPLRFSLRRDHATLNLASANERFPFDVSLEGDLAAGNVSAILIAEDFSPQNLVFLNGELQQYQKWLDTTLSGSVSLMAEGGGAIQYEGRLSGVLPDGLPVGRASFAIDGNGDNNAIWLNNLSVQMERGSIGFGGRIGFSPLSPNGTLAVSSFTLSKTANVNTRLNITTRGRTARLSGAFIEMGSVSLVSPDVSVYMGDKGLRWSFSADEVTNRNRPEPVLEEDEKADSLAEHDEMDVDEEDAIPRKRILVEGVYDYNPQNLDASIMINGATAADIVEMISPFIALPDAPDLAASVVHELYITTELFITTDFTRFLYNAPEINMRRRNVEVYISLAGTERRVEMNQIRVDWGAGSLDGLLYADFMNVNAISFGATASYKNTNYSVEGIFRNGNEALIQGSYGFAASVALSGGALAGSIKADDIPIPIGDAVSYVSVNSSFQFDSPESWEVNLLSLNLLNIATPASPSSTIRLSGTVDQDHVDLPVVFFDDGSALTGNASLLWDRAFSDISGVIAFQNENGGEQYYVELSCDNVLGKGEEKPRYTVWLAGSGMRLAHFLAQDYKAVISGSAYMDWESIDAFSAQVTIDSLDAVVSDSTVHLNGTVAADNERVALSGIQARYGGLRGDIPSLAADLDSVWLPRMLIEGSFAEMAIDLDCGIEMEYGRIASWFDIARVMDAFSGKFFVNNARLDVLQSTEPFEFDFSHKDRLISLFGGPSNMLRFQISDEGDFFADITAPSPVRGTIAGAIANGDIDAFTSDLYVDLAALWRLLPPQNDFVVSGGFVTASLDIRGPLAAPEFFGQAIGESVALQVPPYLKHPIRPVPITVDISGAEMTFGPIPASVGHGAGMVSGWFRFDRWIPNAFILDITAPASTPIPFAFDIMGIVARGDAAGALRLALEDNEFKTSGDLTAQDTVVTLNFEEIENQPPMELNNPVSFVTDIVVRSGRKLEFLWPTAEFPIIQASADLGASLKIENDTSTGSLLLLGDVPLRAGEVFYFERSFYLQEGTLSFNENEIRFDPYISARAEVRDRTDNGQVTISLIIDKSPLSSFTTRLESNPALSQVEIFSLLGQNMTGAPSGDSAGAMQNLFLSSSADILSQLWIIRNAERRIRDWLHLDMFSFRAPIAQNVLSMAFLDQNKGADADQGNSTQRTNGVGNYFDNTTVFLGKYINPNMFVQGMLSLRDEVGQNINGATLAFDLGIELKTPLFNIRWNFVPTLDQTMLNPRSLFVDDMSFTLTWRKSF
ncbi:MAG: translocation/assembly module TamB [Treponema sp.]|nr:translocation/assembly module TamB [Treponema sp.]